MGEPPADVSHHFPIDHFQLSLTHAHDEHRLVLRCSNHFLNPDAALRASQQHGDLADAALKKLENHLYPNVRRNSRTYRRFIQKLKTWALLPHHESGERLTEKHEALLVQLGQLMEKRTVGLPKLFEDYADAFREHHVARLRHDALVRLGGGPDATLEQVKQGFLDHFNRLLDPAGTRHALIRKLAKPLRRRIRNAETPATLVGHYPPLEPLSDLDAHSDYFASDFDLTRRFGLEPGAALESAGNYPADAFILRMHVSSPSVAKPELFNQLQTTFARSLQFMGFPVRIVPPE